MLLTKQPNRAAQFAAWLAGQGIAWPENVWIGTSITSKASLSRIKHLGQIPAAIRYLSLEPLWGDPGLTPAHLHDIQWMIVGGESDQGPYQAHPFDLAWAETLIALGQQTGVAVFLKQLGSRPVNGQPLTLADHHGGDWAEWPPRLRVRQMSFTCR